MTAERTLEALRRANAGVGLACGLVLLLACGFILLEIVMRRVAFGIFGGTDEISGYVMAGVASFAAGYALVERAHIRIDILHRRLPAAGRTALDILSLGGLLAVAIALLYHGWGVLSKSLDAGSTANTPLETPLWIPQLIWLAGWLWFAVAALVLLILTIRFAMKADWTSAAATAAPETDESAIEAELAESGREDAR
ncbi:MAG: TRAP transporter small permease [Pseudomonadota bacterium]